MDALKLLMDLRLWIAVAIVISFTVPSLDLPFSTFIIIVLIVQMTLSMHGLRLSLQDLRDNKKGSLVSIALCYGINTVTTILIGLMFFDFFDLILPFLVWSSYRFYKDIQHMFDPR